MISIIIPVYNAEKYLKTTVGSILAQTYKDFELLLVDDGSTDSSLQICQAFSNQDSRVTVLHKSNGGVSSARNYGLDHANGEYILFSDSDDYHYPDNLEVMANEIKGFDSLICGPDYLECKRKELKLFKNKPHRINFNPIDINCEEDFAKYWPCFDCLCIGQVWRQLYRRDIIEKYHIRFNGLGYECSMFSYTYYLHIKSARLSGFRGYIHILNPGSISTSHKTVQNMTRIKILAKLHSDFIEKHNISDINYIHVLQNRYMFLAATSILKGYYKDTRLSFEGRKECWKAVVQDSWYKDLHYSILKDFRSKIFYIACKFHLQYIFDPILIILMDLKK